MRDLRFAKIGNKAVKKRGQFLIAADWEQAKVRPGVDRPLSATVPANWVRVKLRSDP